MCTANTLGETYKRGTERNPETDRDQEIAFFGKFESIVDRVVVVDGTDSLRFVFVND